MSKTFRGYITDEDWAVFLNGKELDPHYEHCNHSPTGLSWGYNGSGPAQLAFAMLYEVTQDLEFTRKHHQDLKRELISQLDQNSNWSITEEEILAWCKTLKD
jgi:hypothetical protein